SAPGAARSIGGRPRSPAPSRDADRRQRGGGDDAGARRTRGERGPGLAARPPRPRPGAPRTDRGGRRRAAAGASPGIGRPAPGPAPRRAGGPGRPAPAGAALAGSLPSRGLQAALPSLRRLSHRVLLLSGPPGDLPAGARVIPDRYGIRSEHQLGFSALLRVRI